MAVVTWIGPGTGAWDNVANWSSNPALPGALDDVFINTSQTGTITHATGTDTIKSLTINGKPDLAVSGGSLTIAGAFVSKSNTILSGGTLTLNGAGTLAAFSQTDGELTGVGTIAIAANTVLSAGTESGAGTTLAKAGITLSGTGFALDGGRVLELQVNSAATGAGAQLNLNGVNPNTGLSDAGSGTLRIDAGALFDDQTTAGGLLILATNQGGADTGAAARVDNLGTFRRSGAAAVSTIGVAFNNAGVADARTGTLRLSGGGTSTGTFSLLPGAVVEFAGGAATLNGAKTTGTGTILVSGGTVTSDTAFAVGGALTQTGGLLNGAGVITVTGLTSLSGGTESGAGTTVAKSGIALTGAGFGLDGGRVLELQGNSTLTGSGVALNLNAADPGTGLSAAGSGTLRIDAGALLDDQTSDGLTVLAPNQGGGDTGQGALIDNLGTFRRSAATTITTVSAAFNNTGAVDVRTGTLRLAGGGSDTGLFSTLTGTTVEFAGGATTINGSKASGTGQILVSGGSLSVDTTFLVSSDFAQTGGLVTGAGTLTLTNPVTLFAGTQSGAGTTVAKGGVALTGTGFALDGGRVLQLQGNNSTATGAGVTLNLNGLDPNTGLSAAGAGTLLIDAAAVFDDQTSGGGLAILASNRGGTDTGAAALVNNQGTFRRSGSAATSAIAAAFNNAGLLDARTGTLFLDGTVTNTATGIIQIKSGATVDVRGTLANLSGTTLTGGTYSLASKAGVSGVFRYLGATILTNAATISLDGKGAQFLSGTTDALAGLAANTASGSLAVLGDKAFVTAGDFANAGTISTTAPSSFTVTGTLANSGFLQLAGGTTGATVLNNGGEVSGFGSVTPAIANTGIVRAAGGALSVGGGVTGTGTIQIDAGASLTLGQASTAGSLIVNATGAGSLTLGVNPVTVSGDYANAGFGVGNAFDRRAGVAGTGLILAAGGILARQTLSGDIGATTTGDAVLALGNLHVGDTRAKLYQIGDVVAVGPALRGAIQTAVNGGNLTDARLSGSGVTASNFGPVATGGFSAPLSVVLSGLSAGALSGQAVHVVNNFNNTNSQTLSVTGAVYRLAAAGAHTPDSLVFGNHHIGDAVAAQTLTLGNIAPADGFSEKLNASLGGTTAGVLASGAFTGLAAGATDSTSLHVGIDTATAGARSGTATITLASDGGADTLTGIDGLGLTAIGTQTVSVTGAVFRLAAASASSQTVSLGNRHVGDTVAQSLALGNLAAADGSSEKLNASLNAPLGGGATAGITASGAFTGLAAGATDAASLTVGLDTATAGAKSGTATLTLASDGGPDAITGIDGLGLTALGTRTVSVTGAVFRLATIGVQTALVPSFGTVHVGDAVSRAVPLGNLAAADGFSEKLNASLGGATAGVTASGAFTGLAAGGSDTTSLRVGLDTSTSGAKSGTATITLASDGTGVDGLGVTGIGARAVAVVGTVDNYAVAAFQQIAGGGVLTRNGQTYTLSLGTRRIGTGPVALNLGVLNAAPGLADLLDGSLAIGGDAAYTNTGFAAFAGLGAGQADNAPSVSFSTERRGTFSETIALRTTGHNDSGYSASLADETLTITGTVAGTRPANDFNADNNSDLLWQNDDGTAVLWEMNGTSIGGGGVFATLGTDWRMRGSGDFNGDGKADVLWRNTDGSVAVWEMNGTSVIGGGIVGNPGTAWRIKGMADVNADGNADIVWQHDDGSLAIWEMNGAAVIGGGIVGNPGAGWHVKGTGDFNGDGNADILWQHDNGSVAIWEMNGTAVIGGGVVGNPGTGWHVKGTGDFNKDGNADIVWQYDDGSLAIWEMNGTAVIGGDFRNSPGTSWHVIGDDGMRFVSGASGNAILTAATTEDETFLFNTYTSGAHVINGFDPSHDFIAFSVNTFQDFSAVQAHTTASANGMLIALDANSTLLLRGVTPASVTARDFNFV